LEWTASHSKKIGVHTFPLQIGVHEVKSWSAFSLTLIEILINVDFIEYNLQSSGKEDKKKEALHLSRWRILTVVLVKYGG
jgi:hypothetical protein